MTLALLMLNLLQARTTLNLVQAVQVALKEDDGDLGDVTCLATYVLQSHSVALPMIV
jgi:hypothetical protein